MTDSPDPPSGQPPREGDRADDTSPYGQAPAYGAGYTGERGQTRYAQGSYAPPQHPPPQHGPQHGQPPYGQPPYGQPQHGQPQHGQPQYGQPQYGQPQYGQSPYAQRPYPGYAPYGPAYAYQAPTNSMAIAALVLAFVFAPLGIIFGIVARKQIQQTGEQGWGLATAGLWVGVGITAIFVLVIVIWVIALIALLSAAPTAP